MKSASNLDLITQWSTLLERLQKDFGDLENLTDILFLIGVQELGQGYRSFSKDEKVDLIHIGICAILHPLKYYSFQGLDNEGWPHYTLIKELPEMSEKEKETFLQKAVLNYFNEDLSEDHSG